MSLKVKEYTFDGASLRKLPRPIREYLVLAGHMFNEIMVLHRLYFFIRKDDENQIVSNISKTWSLILFRIIGGKVFEFWETTRKRFLQARWSNEEWVRDCEPVQAPLSRLKTRFGQSNLLAMVRNTYAFHNHEIDIDKTIAAFNESDNLEMYLSGSTTNTTYFFSEMLVTSSLIDAIDDSDPQSAFDRFMTETIGAAGDALEFLNQVIGAICHHHKEALGAEYRHSVTLSVEDIPRMGEFYLPVFVRTDDVTDE